MKRTCRDRRIALLGVAAIVVLCGLTSVPRGSAAAPAKDESPRAYCARVGTDDQVRTAPAGLAPDIRRLFHVDRHYAVGAGFFRCADGAVLVCWVGANLPCRKANTANELPAATQWCRTHEHAEFIPMAVTGHDTLYSWRCVGGKAVAGAPVGALDPRGFFAEYWKKVE
ncbi:MAG TPA: hypothetical protein VMF12_04840 [Xanthobacteraceae bacterium]|nr:hypothetical protein [Xanthobacteraceae bacterium]